MIQELPKKSQRLVKPDENAHQKTLDEIEKKIDEINLKKRNYIEALVK